MKDVLALNQQHKGALLHCFLLFVICAPLPQYECYKKYVHTHCLRHFYIAFCYSSSVHRSHNMSVTKNMCIHIVWGTFTLLFAIRHLCTAPTIWVLQKIYAYTLFEALLHCFLLFVICAPLPQYECYKKYMHTHCLRHFYIAFCYSSSVHRSHNMSVTKNMCIHIVWGTFTLLLLFVICAPLPQYECYKNICIHIVWGTFTLFFAIRHLCTAPTIWVLQKICAYTLFEALLHCFLLFVICAPLPQYECYKKYVHTHCLRHFYIAFCYSSSVHRSHNMSVTKNMCIHIVWGTFTLLFAIRHLCTAPTIWVLQKICAYTLFEALLHCFLLFVICAPLPQYECYKKYMHTHCLRHFYIAFCYSSSVHRSHNMSVTKIYAYTLFEALLHCFLLFVICAPLPQYECYKKYVHTHCLRHFYIAFCYSSSVHRSHNMSVTKNMCIHIVWGTFTLLFAIRHLCTAPTIWVLQKICAYTLFEALLHCFLLFVICAPLPQYECYKKYMHTHCLRHFYIAFCYSSSVHRSHNMSVTKNICIHIVWGTFTLLFAIRHLCTAPTIWVLQKICAYTLFEALLHCFLLFVICAPLPQYECYKKYVHTHCLRHFYIAFCYSSSVHRSHNMSVTKNTCIHIVWGTFTLLFAIRHLCTALIIWVLQKIYAYTLFVSHRMYYPVYPYVSS